jgi:hypothetical protein
VGTLSGAMAFDAALSEPPLKHQFGNPYDQIIIQLFGASSSVSFICALVSVVLTLTIFIQTATIPADIENIHILLRRFYFHYLSESSKHFVLLEGTSTVFEGQYGIVDRYPGFVVLCGV